MRAEQTGTAQRMSTVRYAFYLIIIGCAVVLIYLLAATEIWQPIVESVRLFDLLQQRLANGDFHLAREYEQQGDKDRAGTARAQARQRLEQVKSAYEALLRYYPDNARALTYYGELLYDRFGQRRLAIRAWEKAVPLDKTFSTSRNNLALAYCTDMGKYQEGLTLLEEVLELEPENPNYLYNTTQVYLVYFPEVEKRYGWSRQRLFREAMEFSKQAADLAEDDFELHQDYAVNFFTGDNIGAQVDWGEAAAAWQKARVYARRERDVFFTWFNEARAWILEGNSKRAEACLREALLVLPNNKPAKNMLAKLSRDHGAC